MTEVSTLIDDINDKNFLNAPLLIKDALGGSSIYYTDSTGNINYKTYAPNLRRWLPGDRLAGDVCCFTGTVTLNKTILVTIKNNGSFNIHQHINDKWNTSNFFQLDINKTASHPQLTAGADEYLHLINLVNSRHPDHWSLLHHIYNGRDWEDTRVIEFGKTCSPNYGHVVMDRLGRLHMVYRVQEETGNTLYYRTYNPAEQTWSRATVVASDSDNIFPNLLVDANSYLHLIWCSQLANSCIIRYRRRLLRGWPVGRWGPIIELSKNEKTKVFPYLSYGNDILWATWIASQDVYRRKTYQNGEAWEEKNYIEPIKKTSLFHRSISYSDNIPVAQQWTYSGGMNYIVKDNEEFGEIIEGSKGEIGSQSSEAPALASISRRGEKDILQNFYPQPKTGENRAIFEDKKELKINDPTQRHGNKNRSTGVIISTDPTKIPTSKVNLTQTLTSSPDSTAPPFNDESKALEYELKIKDLEKKHQKNLQKIKEKHEASRKVWEEENLRLLKENQHLKKMLQK